MNKNWDNLVKVDFSEDSVPCKGCGANLLDINNIKYAGETKAEPTSTEELCVCRKCSTEFIIRYELFDGTGHINPKTFSNDINDPNHNWQNNLTEEQKKTVSDHLNSCTICINRLNEETLKDAWFASIIHAKGGSK